jgi:hypothetical protein
MSIIPGHIDLMMVEREAASNRHKNYGLRDALKAHSASLAANEAANAPTYVLIDCPPSLNVLTLNALAAADAVIVPLQCEFFALEGLSLLVDTIDEARKSLNPNLIIDTTGRGGCARVSGQEGLCQYDPAQRAFIRGPVLRAAGARLRYAVQGFKGLYRGRQGADPPRARTGGGLRSLSHGGN